MVFHWSLRDSKSPQVSRICLRILVVLSNAVIWIVSTRPPTSKSSRPFNNPLVIIIINIFDVYFFFLLWVHFSPDFQLSLKNVFYTQNFTHQREEYDEVKIFWSLCINTILVTDWGVCFSYSKDKINEKCHVFFQILDSNLSFF